MGHLMTPYVIFLLTRGIKRILIHPIMPLLICSMLVSSSFDLHAQYHPSQNEPHHSKEKGIYELITSSIFAYSFDSEQGVLGVETHFTYWFDHTWGTGGSYTARFEEEETLHDLALLGSINPTRWLTLNAGPNFGLPSEHRDLTLGAYAEAEINIRPSAWFHFGPIIGTVISEHSELSAGIHMGFEF